MDVQTPAGKMKCHAMLLQCSVDLPARALVLNSKQFNGKYGCFILWIYWRNTTWWSPA